jgi:hypothetical protein
LCGKVNKISGSAPKTLEPRLEKKKEQMKDEAFLTPTILFIAASVFTLMLGVVDWASGYELQFFSRHSTNRSKAK